MTHHEIEVRVAPPVPACHTCGRRLARFAGPGPETGWTCVVCEGPGEARGQEREPLADPEPCSCEEALALRERVRELEEKCYVAALQVSNAYRDLSEAEERVRGLKAQRDDLQTTVRANQHAADREYRRRIKAEERAENLEAMLQTPMLLHEQAVLDASHLILDSSLRRIREVEGGCLGDWAAAELARREAKR